MTKRLVKTLTIDCMSERFYHVGKTSKDFTYSCRQVPLKRYPLIFRKLVSIVGLGMGNIFGLMLRFMPTWWSFLIFWVLMMGTIHAAHISASVYETELIF